MSLCCFVYKSKTTSTAILSFKKSFLFGSAFPRLESPVLPWKDENDNEKIAPVPGPRSQGRVVENPRGRTSSRTSIISEDGKTLVCDTRDRAITWEFCRDLHLTLVFSGLFKAR